jgi:hypothetical protein
MFSSSTNSTADSPRGPYHRLIKAGFHRPGKLTAHYTMVARLTDLMHIDQQVLLIDRDLDAVPWLEVRQALCLPHSHGNVPRFHFSGVDAGLVASDFYDGAQQDPISGQQLRMIVTTIGSDGDRGG